MASEHGGGWKGWVARILGPLLTRRAAPSGSRALVYEGREIIGEVRKP